MRFRPDPGLGLVRSVEPARVPVQRDQLPACGTSHATGLNAYFDVLLQLGWVGLVLFVVFAGIALVRSWLDASERRSVIYAWTPLILVALLVDSMFESFTLSGIGWLLLVLCAVRAGKSRSWRERMDGSGADAGPAARSGSAQMPQGRILRPCPSQPTAPR